MTTISEEIEKLWKGSFGWDSCRMSEKEIKELSKQYSLQTLKLFEQLIDTIEYDYDSDWHCQNAVDNAKDYLKEKLNE